MRDEEDVCVCESSFGAGGKWFGCFRTMIPPIDLETPESVLLITTRVSVEVDFAMITIIA